MTRCSCSTVYKLYPSSLVHLETCSYLLDACQPFYVLNFNRAISFLSPYSSRDRFLPTRLCSDVNLDAMTGQDFTDALFQRWQLRCEVLGGSPADLVTTLTRLTAWSIADAYERFSKVGVKEVQW